MDPDIHKDEFADRREDDDPPLSDKQREPAGDRASKEPADAEEGDQVGVFPVVLPSTSLTKGKRRGIRTPVTLPTRNTLP